MSYQELKHDKMRAKWPWIAHLSFVLSIGSYRYLLETGHAPGDPTGGSSLVQQTNLNVVY